MYVADMHCDTISKIFYHHKRGEQACLLSNNFQVDLCKLEQGGYLLQNFAIFVDIGLEAFPYQCAKDQIAVFYEEIRKNASKIGQARTVKEIRKNRDAGKLSAILTLEEGEICEGDLRKLEEFYQEGVRMMSFTWNYENSLGTERGLTDLGIVFLEKMEDLGIIPDVSHLSQAGFYDVCRYSKKPFVASHSNATALCGHKRNLTDDMIRKMAERGGVIGVNFYGLFLEEGLENADEKPSVYSRIERIADHILHMIHVGGSGCVGLGSDFDGIDDNLELSDCSKIGRLELELKKRGLSEREIEGVFCQNVLTLYKECWRNCW